MNDTTDHTPRSLPSQGHASTNATKAAEAPAAGAAAVSDAPDAVPPAWRRAVARPGGLAKIHAYLTAPAPGAKIQDLGVARQRLQRFLRFLQALAAEERGRASRLAQRILDYLGDDQSAGDVDGVNVERLRTFLRRIDPARRQPQSRAPGRRPGRAPGGGRAAAVRKQGRKTDAGEPVPLSAEAREENEAWLKRFIDG
ncbi:hypothetical protein [uncultured Thiohalocapsa sp.]|uniref:hypothetical protein n=1 Tax=uncultured Thiohalocapsa sp. TaxID=768990 RepID=UPI0025DCEBDF|nr:hypothetical protein [uncultured Thiohalocapsa sp.]